MKQIFISLCRTAMVPLLLWVGSADAQVSPSEATLSLAQAEHNAADLKQGMTVDEVQKLLGKPTRTALKSDSNSAATPSKGTLQWTYSWSSASSQGSLRVEFISKSLEEWYVNSWQWLTF